MGDAFVPLPNEPFDWSGLPEDIHGSVNDVLVWLDRVLDAEFDDIELRTAARRLLARAARGDPAVFRSQNAKAQNSAAAIAYLVVGDNGLFTYHGGVGVRELLACFGVPGGTASQRAETFRRAAGLPWLGYDLISLPPEMLTSKTRRDLGRGMTHRRLP